MCFQSINNSNPNNDQSDEGNTNVSLISFMIPLDKLKLYKYLVMFNTYNDELSAILKSAIFKYGITEEFKYDVRFLGNPYTH